VQTHPLVSKSLLHTWPGGQVPLHPAAALPPQVVVGQGFGVQVPGPTLTPPWAAHCAAVSTVQMLEAQHWIGPCVVVVVELVDVEVEVEVVEVDVVEVVDGDGRVVAVAFASRIMPGNATAPGPGSSQVGSTIALSDGGMQNTLTSVAACDAPSAMQAFAGVPVSVMVVASKFRNAPLLCCMHCVKGDVVHCELDVHGCGGLANIRALVAQKPQKISTCPTEFTVEKAVFVCVPVDRLKSTGRQPMNEVFRTAAHIPAGWSMPIGAFGGGQSWLVG
jgi:hypothetical protein